MLCRKPTLYYFDDRLFTSHAARYVPQIAGGLKAGGAIIYSDGSPVGLSA